MKKGSFLGRWARRLGALVKWRAYAAPVAGAASGGGGKSPRALIWKDTMSITALRLTEQLFLMSGRVGVNAAPRDLPQIVVSVTTILPRLADVWSTIEMLLHQTMKPDAIVLWLDKERCTEAELPLALLAQRERGLTIRFCEDIGPHTKLIPAMKEYPDAVIITVDDDVLYPVDLVERLVRAHRKAPEQIICTRAREIKAADPQNVSYQRDWPNLGRELEGLDVVPLGVGGVLYPPRVFGDAEVFQLELQRQLAPKADDIWFKAMSLRQGIVCRRLHFAKEAFPVRPNSQEVELGQFNVNEGGNDIQIRATFEHYGLWPVVQRAIQARKAARETRG